MPLNEYYPKLSQLFEYEPFGLPQKEKVSKLCQLFEHLHSHHLTHSCHYNALCSEQSHLFSDYSDIPFVAVRLFKLLELKSIADDEVFRQLTSSGTTSQVRARVYLDRDTSARQSKALVKIIQSFCGKQRLPMLIIDSPSVLNKRSLSARAAGVQGMMFFGRDHTYALDEHMNINLAAIEQFCDKHRGKPILIFGFTFMVYFNFLVALEKSGVAPELDNAILFHSGGWKKMAQQAVSNAEFKRRLLQQCGIRKVHNFYGMAEQVGSVFVECEKGVLHAPSIADIVIRNPYDLKPVNTGEVGLIQVLSALPTSYPGYSILTEDQGRLLGEDDCQCGRKGRYFEVLERLPNAELRGCSDTGATVT